MKVAHITGRHQYEIVNQPAPQAKGDLVVIKVLSAPMCTEYKSFKAGLLPRSLGHEAAGEVVEVDRTSRLKIGDRVAFYPAPNWCGVCEHCKSGYLMHCLKHDHKEYLKKIFLDENQNAGLEERPPGTWAEYLLAKEKQLISLSEDISTDHGSMMCCALNPTFGAMQEASVEAGDTVLIIGMGPVGLGGVINAVHRRARAIALEPHPYRRKLAKQLGAEAAIDPGEEGTLEQILELTGGSGVDVAIDCTTNNTEAVKMALEALRKRGKLVLLGGEIINEEKKHINLNVETNFIYKGITIGGSWAYNIMDAPSLLEVIRDSGSLLDQLITHRLPMSGATEAFEIQARGECGKLILNPWEQ